MTILLMLLFIPLVSANTENIASATIGLDSRQANWYESIQCKYQMRDDCAEGEDNNFLIITTPLETITQSYWQTHNIYTGDEVNLYVKITWDTVGSYANNDNTCFTDITPHTGTCSVDSNIGYYALFLIKNPNGQLETTLGYYSTHHSQLDSWTISKKFTPTIEGTYEVKRIAILTQQPDATWIQRFKEYSIYTAYGSSTSTTGVVASDENAESMGALKYLYVVETKTCPDPCPLICSGKYMGYDGKCNTATGKCDYYTYEYCPNGCTDGACNPTPSYCGDGTCDADENYQSCPSDCINPCMGVICSNHCEGNIAKYNGDCNEDTGECIYQSQICQDRCVDGACINQIDKCEGVTPAKDHCVLNIRYYGGECNPQTGIWEYQTMSCPDLCVSGICTGGGCNTNDDCNDNNPQTTDKCTNNVCSNTPIVVDDDKCGDGICDADESFISCPQDCESESLSILLLLIILIIMSVYVIKKSKKKGRRKG